MAMLEASREETVDVAVVGGGPGGLATAAAVISAFGDSASVKVFESQKAFKLQGSVIGVAVNAQHALEAISPDLLTKFTSQGLMIDEMSHYDTTGKLTSNHSIARQAMKDFSEKYNKMPFLLGWHECRQLLFDELPPGTVQFDKQMRHYEEGEDGVTLHFDRGQPPVHAKVLVGADGYFSKVRTQCLNDGPPTFNGPATSISLWLQFFTLLIYIVFLKKGEPTWPGWSKESLVDWWPFVKLAVPSMLLISEWWASETAVMMGGLLPDAQRQLSAMAIYQTTNAMCFMLPLGIAVAVSTRVSNELGAGNPKTARHTTNVGLFLTLTTTTCLNVPIFFFRKQWGALFSTDPELAALIAQTLTVLAFYIPLDGLSVVLGGVIRGAGKQLLAAPCVIVSYYALGLPAAAYFAFNLGFGVRGLCLGTLLGTAAHAGSFYFLVWKLDWNLEAHRAAARVKGQKAVALQTILTPSSEYDDCQQDVAEINGGKADLGSGLDSEAEEEDERAGLLAGVIADSVLSVRSDNISFAEGSETDGQGSLAK